MLALSKVSVFKIPFSLRVLIPDASFLFYVLKTSKINISREGRKIISSVSQYHNLNSLIGPYLRQHKNRNQTINKTVFDLWVVLLFFVPSANIVSFTLN